MCWQVLPLPLENFEPGGIEQSEGDLKIICIFKKKKKKSLIAIMNSIKDSHTSGFLFASQIFITAPTNCVLCKCGSCTISVMQHLLKHTHKKTLCPNQLGEDMLITATARNTVLSVIVFAQTKAYVSRRPGRVQCRVFAETKEDLKYLHAP